MSLVLGVVMDPIEHIKPWKDTTLALLLEAERRGWTLLYMEPEDLFLRDGRVRAFTRPLRVFDSEEHWFDRGDAVERDLGGLDIILMRQDPPFNQEYLYATYLLEKVEREGVLVSNHPASVRDSNEKLFATDFAQCCAPTLVSARKAQLRAFVDEQGDTVMKPLDEMGGNSIFRVGADSPNINVIIDLLTHHQRTPIMAQRYIPEITAGDKRILMIGGRPVDRALARIPGRGEFRGNLAAGGTGEGRELNDRDRWICEQVGPTLERAGLHFVGLDVIGDYLTEINVTSPTCVRELDRWYGYNIAGQLFDYLVEQLETRTRTGARSPA
jgi:glutathione synthase